MRFRSTVVLLALFFAGLAALWYVDQARIPTRDQRRQLSNRLLPELVDVAPGDITRLEVETFEPASRLAVERRDGGLWQLTAPVDAAADPMLVETLVRNLVDLRTSTDAGTIEGNAASFGLDRPRASVRLYGPDRKTVLARLDLGTISRDFWYVRPGDAAGIEVVDARLLGLLRQDVIDWRDRALFRTPSFRVAGVTVVDADPKRSVTLRRDERRWRLVEPVRTAADDDRAEGFVAELGALRAADGTAGFVADGVTDLALYGLDRPAMTITLTPFDGYGRPRTVRLGKAVPEQPDHVYALRDDQDDILSVPVRLLRESFAEGPNSFRSKRVGDIEPARVARVRIDWKGKRFDLAKTADGWQRLSPANDKADLTAVASLLARLNETQASEFLEADRVPTPRLEPPDYRIQVWQPEPGKPVTPPASTDDPPSGELRLDLRIGRHDLVRKSLYGQLAGDRTILALTDRLVDSLPRNEYAFRDQAVVTFDPARVERLTVEQPEKTVTVQAPGSGRTSLNWRLTEPVDAPADDRAVTALLLALSKLRAASWESTAVGDGSAFGLDRPRLRIRWTIRTGPAPTGPGSTPSPTTTETLRVGATKPGPDGGTVYANIEGESGVFTIQPPLAALLEAELHDRKVLRIPRAEVQRLVFQWPNRSIALRRGALTAPGRPGAGWAPELGYDAAGLDFAHLDGLLQALENLETTRFVQYRGPFPESLGLDPPRLSLTLERARPDGPARPIRLRFGAMRDGMLVATTTDGPDGAAFLLPPSDTWSTWTVPPRRLGDLPADPFAAP